jgi:Hsp90 protein.
VEEPLDDDDEEAETKDEADKTDDVDDEDTKVEEDKQDDKPKTKTVEKTVWDWEVLNDNKPIWTRK